MTPRRAAPHVDEPAPATGEHRRVDHLRIGDEIVDNLYNDGLRVAGIVVGVWSCGRMSVTVGVEDRHRGRLTIDAPGEHEVVVARPQLAAPVEVDPATPARALLLDSPAIAAQLIGRMPK